MTLDLSSVLGADERQGGQQALYRFETRGQRSKRVEGELDVAMRVKLE